MGKLWEAVSATPVIGVTMGHQIVEGAQERGGICGVHGSCVLQGVLKLQAHCRAT